MKRPMRDNDTAVVERRAQPEAEIAPSPIPEQASAEPPAYPGLATRRAAHDFNNLLTVIIGAADSVLNRPGVDPETRADLACIRDAAGRGAALVRYFQTGEPAPPPRQEPIALNEIIRASARMLTHTLGQIYLTLELGGPDDLVRADPADLGRVLLNLALNARHAMPHGGTVTLRTARSVLTLPRHEAPDLIPAGDYLTIAVTDNGTGIPARTIPLLFEPGFSTRHDQGGSGLGLATVRAFARQSAGFLAVESLEGRGTCVQIYLPRLAGKPAAAPMTPVLATSRTVLVVDDDLLVRSMTERMFFRAGWRVLTAESAAAALAILEWNLCDLMITDVTMPDTDGIALTRLVLTRWPELPVIITSGYQHHTREAGPPGARVAFLTKPYGQADLLAAVADVAGIRDAR